LRSGSRGVPSPTHHIFVLATFLSVAIGGVLAAALPRAAYADAPPTEVRSAERASTEEAAATRLVGPLPEGGGTGFVTWFGGTVGELLTAAGERGCAARSVWALLDGEFVGYSTGSPAFVNAEWTSAYPASIPGPAPFLVVCAEVQNTLLPDTPTTIHRLVIGRSVEGRPIEVSCAGEGTHLALLVGGMHTGIEANTVTLARRVEQEMRQGVLAIPDGVQLCVLPVLNPDGLARDERTNANGVDLNRNWPAEDWSAEAFHPASGPVSGGPRPLSEPETQALADFVRDVAPAVIVTWHSYAALVDGNSLPLAGRLGRAYAAAAGLEYVEHWDPYPITGQLIDAMERDGVVAIDVSSGGQTTATPTDS